MRFEHCRNLLWGTQKNDLLYKVFSGEIPDVHKTMTWTGWSVFFFFGYPNVSLISISVSSCKWLFQLTFRAHISRVCSLLHVSPTLPKTFFKIQSLAWQLQCASIQVSLIIQGSVMFGMRTTHHIETANHPLDFETIVFTECRSIKGPCKWLINSRTSNLYRHYGVRQISGVYLIIQLYARGCFSPFLLLLAAAITLSSLSLTPSFSFFFFSDSAVPPRLRKVDILHPS